MRTNEERIAALHVRTAQLQKEQKNRQFRILCAISGIICICILAGISALISRVSREGFSVDAQTSMNASIFSGNGVSGYLVIAILAFLLGITVTLFCIRLKKHLEMSRNDLPGKSEK